MTSQYIIERIRRREKFAHAARLVAKTKKLIRDTWVLIRAARRE